MSLHARLRRLLEIVLAPVPLEERRPLRVPHLGRRPPLHRTPPAAIHRPHQELRVFGSARLAVEAMPRLAQFELDRKLMAAGLRDIFRVVPAPNRLELVVGVGVDGFVAEAAVGRA